VKYGWGVDLCDHFSGLRISRPVALDFSQCLSDRSSF